MDHDGMLQMDYISLLKKQIDRHIYIHHLICLKDLELVFDVLDHDGMRQMDYSFFMHAVLGEMNEFRKALVRKVFIQVNFI